MSNGGYKGATPPRETSPEHYPGVWGLPEQFQAQADGNWPFQETDCAPKSLRFNGSSAYLSRTPTANSNRRTFTWSGWVKSSPKWSGLTLPSGGMRQAAQRLRIRRSPLPSPDIVTPKSDNIMKK